MTAVAGPSDSRAAPGAPASEPGDDVAGFLALTDKIARERGFRCGSYKEKCLRRRIAVRMRARGVHTYADYMRLLDREAPEFERLLDALTINVTKLFRNYEAFDAIAQQVIPVLWGRPEHDLNVWSAGCSSGEEPYSLAVLFRRHMQAAGRTGLPKRVMILGTDIDRASLEAARRGAYADAAFTDTPPELRANYFGAAAPHLVNADVRALVRFESLDMLREAAPPGPTHLITCRNVLIYFDRDTQEALFRKFHDALVPGGFLVLGKVETLLGRARSLFTTVDARERIFRRT